MPSLNMLKDFVYADSLNLNDKKTETANWSKLQNL